MIRAATIALAALSAPAMADDAKDFTPVPKCEDVSYTASISVFSKADAVGHCRSMEKVLEGVRVQDIRAFETAAYILSRSGYHDGQYDQIIKELVEIVRLRGQYDKPDKWDSTLNVVWKGFEGTKGDVSPYTIRTFLKGAGPMAKTLSDDGLVNMIAVMHTSHQSGDWTCQTNTRPSSAKSVPMSPTPSQTSATDSARLSCESSMMT
jgi:hypothetical protein